jgi:hypothetical protein
MATAAQVRANRANTRKSTGSRTPTGKERACQNAVKHGLLAREAVIPGEDPEEFRGLPGADAGGAGPGRSGGSDVGGAGCQALLAAAAGGTAPKRGRSHLGNPKPPDGVARATGSP